MKAAREKHFTYAQKSFSMAELRKRARVCYILKEMNHLPKNLFIARLIFKDKEWIKHVWMEET